jgi:hypothetical protein
MNTLTLGAPALPAFAIHSGDPQLDQGLQSIEHRFVQMHLKAESLHISKEQQWHAFWRRFVSNRPQPEVNFEAHDLLIVLMGNQRSGGHSVAIGPVEATPNGMQVGVLFWERCCEPGSLGPHRDWHVRVVHGDLERIKQRHACCRWRVLRALVLRLFLGPARVRAPPLRPLTPAI